MNLSTALLSDLPDAARAWVHPSRTLLSDETQAEFLRRLREFVEGWSSHDKNVQGGATILHDRFILLAGARIDGADPSGCAIDDASHAVDEIARALEVEWVPSLHVLYQAEDGSIAAVSRGTFQDHIEAGSVTAETLVFDPSVTTLGGVRHGDFQKPAGESWHADAFSLPDLA